jgi:LruC domain-containing protein
MPGKGKSPFVIIVPDKFKYPREGVSIKSAYPGFLEWVQNKNASRDWYQFAEDSEKIFPSLFK